MGFILVIPTHVKLHTYANWAIDLESKNAFVQCMSVVSVIYNYFGFFSFTGTMAWFRKAGLTSSAYAEVKECIVKGIDNGMHNHTAI